MQGDIINHTHTCWHDTIGMRLLPFHVPHDQAGHWQAQDNKQHMFGLLAYI